MERNKDYKKSLSSTTLRTNYCRWALSCDMFADIDELKGFFKNYQAHHIIPKAVVYEAYERGYIGSQEEINQFDGAWNCIMIPSSKEKSLYHLGSHEEYSNMVLKQIFSHDNKKTQSFLQRCHNYIFAMNLQMAELLNDDSGKWSISVRDLGSFLDESYDRMAKVNLGKEPKT